MSKLEIEEKKCPDEITKPNKLKISGAWYLTQLPLCIVIELATGELRMIYTSPFRQITNDDLMNYGGYHPRKMRGQPLPNYLYKFYNLEKSNETATEVIHVRLTPSEKLKVESMALDLNKNVSELIRHYIKSF